MWKLITGAGLLVGSVCGLVKDAADRHVNNCQQSHESGRRMRNDIVMDTLRKQPYAKNFLLPVYARTERYQSEQMQNVRRDPITSWLNSIF